MTSILKMCLLRVAQLALLICQVTACSNGGSDQVERLGDLDLPTGGDAFEPASTVDEVQRQLRRLPDDDIWWMVNGEDMAWNFRNLHQIFPTVNVYRNGPVKPLAYRPMDAIAEYEVVTPDGPMSFESFLLSDQSTAMGVVILHHGEIVFERYPRMQEYEKPVYWSVAKIFVSTVIRIFEERGLIDVSLPIETYIPEINNSSFAGISVRDILDMATGLDCADEYLSRDACYYRYSMAIGDGFRTEDAPDNPYDFVATLQAEKVDEPGEKFSYSGLNTFVLAWLVEKVTDMPFQDVFTREIWYHIGAEADASYIAPRYGVPVTHGGFLARMRDVARFGLLFTPSYHVVSDIRIISDEHLALIDSGGRPELRANAGMPPVSESGIKHNVYQWDEIYANGNFYKGGWAGQGLLVNPRLDVVAVFTGYFKDDNYSEVKLKPLLLELLDGVFGSHEPVKD